MKRLKIAGYAYALPNNSIKFKNQTCYRVKQAEDYFSLVENSVHSALQMANITMDQIDCIVAAMATPLQAIPCNAALIHERVAFGRSIPAFDINSSCTSFITALDTLSYMIHEGRYKHVLLVSGDIASAALNPKETESYELFSDVCTAFVVTYTTDDSGVLYAKQNTFSEGAHQTEIPRGGSLSPAFCMSETNHDEYYFTMKGKEVVRLTIQKLGTFLSQCSIESKYDIKDFTYVIPHQASRILPSLMNKVGFQSDQYINIVKDYGNMVSGSIPFAFCKSLEKGIIKRGDDILLIGTAAGLTISYLILRY